MCGKQVKTGFSDRFIFEKLRLYEASLGLPFLFHLMLSNISFAGGWNVEGGSNFFLQWGQNCSKKFLLRVSFFFRFTILWTWVFLTDIVCKLSDFFIRMKSKTFMSADDISMNDARFPYLNFHKLIETFAISFFIKTILFHINNGSILIFPIFQS